MLSIFLGAVAIFIFGAVWFTVIFGRTWAKLMGFDASQNGQGEKMSMVKPLIMNFLVNILIVYSVNYLSPLPESLLNFFQILFIVWLGFSFPIFANAAIWERKTWKLVFINSAQSLIALLIAGTVVYYMR